MVNCAFSDYVPSNSKYKKFTFDNFNLDQWYSDLDVGLTGAFICSKIFGAEMNKNKRGNIINISSDLGIISPDQRIYKKLNFVKPSQLLCNQAWDNWSNKIYFYLLGW